MQLSDFEVLQLWQRGDEGAGNALVRRHFAALHRFFTLKLGAVGEELVQETFMACAAQRDRLPTVGSFKAYLFGIARRQLFLHLRRERPLDVAISELTLEDLQTTMGGAVALRDEQRMLLTALRHLPLDQQIALELFYWEQMTIPEIALALDAPVGTIKARLSRARDRVREQLLGGALDSRSTESIRVEFEQWAREMGRGLVDRSSESERG